MLKKRAGAAAVVTAASLITGGVVGLSASPASAACDSISVATPAKSGHYAKANSSICAQTNWHGQSYIERDRGLYWDTVTTRSIQGAGPGVTKQYPLSWDCSGVGTYTYRGQIWMSNTITIYQEHSSTRRFSC